MRIAVIGAGIGGLCAAAGLSKAGATVTVLERSSTLRQSGSGLSIFGNGLNALEALGLSEMFQAVSEHPMTLTGGQRRPDGHWLCRIPVQTLSRLHIVHRQDLHEMLREAASDTTLLLGVDVRVTKAGLVQWKGPKDYGTEEQFDLVVAADGINSEIRRTLFNENVRPQYAGYSAWRGITQTGIDLNGEAGETWGHGERFGIAPLCDGRIYWFAVAKLPQNSQFDNEYEEVRRRFSHWHQPISSIIEQTRPDDVFRQNIYDLNLPLGSFVRDNAVLLGDAAHAMTPNLGQGGNQAIEDAATLVACLKPLVAQASPSRSAVQHALSRYDTARRKRTQAIAQKSRRLGVFANAHSPAAVWGRNLLMSLAPPALITRQLESVQTWQIGRAHV